MAVSSKALPEVYGSNGPLQLAASLGQGGEGSVYGLVGDATLAVKVFRETNEDRIDKLMELVAMDNPRLRLAGAWPHLLLTGHDGSVVGYQMEFLQGWVPLFSVYQVRSRLRILPNASWSYLIRVARNLTTCVHYIHEAGLVIGDLNESNVLADSRGMARLIDVDSFQVGEHRCQVGKSELTPPELQGRSLQNRLRSPNDDLFALAILLFQTLVFGRHPYAGCTEGDREATLESHIKAGHYAWTTRRSVPVHPPQELSIDWLPAEIRGLFEDAFDPDIRHRPSAIQWFEALKRLEAHTTACTGVETHVYWSGAERCPWCDLEEKWGVSLFHSSQKRVMTRPANSLDTDALLQELYSVPPPKVVEAPKVPNHDQVEPAKLKWYERMGPGVFWLWLIPFWLQTFSGSAYFPVLMGSTFALIGLPSLFSLAQHIHLRRKKGAAPTKQFVVPLVYKLRPLLQEWHHLAEVSFQARRSEYELLVEEYRNVDNRAERIKLELVKRSHRPEIDAYLSKFSVVASGLLNNRTSAALEKARIQSAADCTRERLEPIAAVDLNMQKALILWREDLTSHYLSTSTFGLTPSQTDLLERRLKVESDRLVKRLKQGPEELRQLAGQIEGRQRDIATEAQPLLDDYESVIHLFRSYCKKGYIKLDRPEELYLS
ncbi:MAG: hypothetical protein JSS66_08210 [Armatimonadetes bacterium]|nr:hypothetical protein [Armatimonadota bacterium]